MVKMHGLIRSKFPPTSRSSSFLPASWSVVISVRPRVSLSGRPFQHGAFDEFDVHRFFYVEEGAMLGEAVLMQTR